MEATVRREQPLGCHRDAATQCGAAARDGVADGAGKAGVIRTRGVERRLLSPGSTLGPGQVMETFSKSILIVHDDAELVRQIADALGRHGCRVEHAGSAREAFSRVQRDTLRPRMVIVDWAVPTAERFPFVEQMMSNPRLASIPIVMLVDPIQTREVSSQGVRAVLSMPVRPRVLAEIVATLCGFTGAE